MEPNLIVESTHGLRVLVIGGSVRAGCTGAPVTAWAARAVADNLQDAEVDRVDPAEVMLPPSRQLQPGGSAPTALTERIDRADAFVFVTPEYNAGYPARRSLGITAPWKHLHDGPAGPVYVPDESTAGAMTTAVGELAWWARTLRAGRLASVVPA